MLTCEKIRLHEDDIKSLLLIKSQLGSVPQEYFQTEEDPLKRHILELAYIAIERQANNDVNGAFDILLDLYKHLKVFPNLLINLMAFCAIECSRKSEMASIIQDYAINAVEEQRFSDAMNAIKNVFSFADGGVNMWMFKNIQSMLKTRNALKVIADQTPKVSFTGRNNQKKRLAMVSVNLVDHVMAYSKTAMQFARYLDRDQYDCYLYFAEETWQQKPQSFPIRFDQVHSSQAAPDFFRELNSMPITVRTCPPVDAYQSAIWLAQQMEEDKIDGVIFQAGVNSAVQWVASKISNVPIKTSMCLGLNMYQEGMDAVVYMNNENLLREKEFWDERWGTQKFICGGADRKEANESPALDRNSFNLTDKQIVFGVMTNYIDVRITDEYLECVSKILEECPDSMFLCMGNGSNEGPVKFMKDRGLEDRCRWLPQQRNSYSALKLLDFYFNEIPVGGSQVIRECMASEVPAMAMKYSPAHHESVGANIVGEEQAVMKNDPDEYIQKAINWIRDPSLRNEALQRQNERSEELYSAKKFVSRLADLMTKK